MQMNVLNLLYSEQLINENLKIKPIDASSSAIVENKELDSIIRRTRRQNRGNSRRR